MHVNHRYLWFLHLEFPVELPKSLSGAAKNRKVSIPKIRQAARFFAPKFAPLRDFASHFRLCTRGFRNKFVVFTLVLGPIL